MSVIKKTTNFLSKESIASIVIAILLSTIMLDYAFSSITFGVLGAYTFFILCTKKKVCFQKELVLPIIIYVLFLTSYFWSVNTDLTLKGIGRTVSLIVCPLIFCILPKFKLRQTNLILEIYSKLNVLYAIFFLGCAIFNFQTTKSFSSFTYHNLVSVFELNAIYVSAYFALSFSYLVSKKEKTLVDIVGAMILLMTIILLSSKMMIVVISGLIFVLLFKQIKKSNYKTAGLFGTIFIGVIIVLVSLKPFNQRFVDELKTNVSDIVNKEQFGRDYVWTGSSIRLLQLRILSDQLKEEDIFFKGFGLFASRENLRDRHINYNTYYGFHKYNYHNQYAQIIAELGIIGLLLLFSVLFLNIKNALRAKHTAFIFFSISMALLFMTESFLWTQRGLFFFIIVYCLFNRTDFKSDKR